MRARSVSLVVAWFAFLACGTTPPAAPLQVPTSSPSPAPVHRPVAEEYDIVHVSPRVHVFQARESKSPIVSGNMTAIVGDDGVLLVDTGQFPSIARHMIADLRKITPKPVKVVLNTHWHNDHVFGNAVVRDAYPGVRFVAQEETKRLLGIKGPKQVETYKTKVGPFIDGLRQKLEAGNDEEGKPLTPDGRRTLEEKIADGEASVALWRDVELALPAETFKDEMTVPLGGIDVKLLHLGRGNTAGDAMAYVPEGKILITGDVVVAPTPYGIGSYPREWRVVFEKMRAIEVKTIVPGHGGLQKDWSFVGDVDALIGAVDTQVERAVKDGRSLEETRKAVDLGGAAYKVTGDDPYRKRNLHDYFETPLVGRAYEEHTSGLKDE